MSYEDIKLKRRDRNVPWLDSGEGLPDSFREYKHRPILPDLIDEWLKFVE